MKRLRFAAVIALCNPANLHPGERDCPGVQRERPTGGRPRDRRLSRSLARNREMKATLRNSVNMVAVALAVSLNAPVSIADGPFAGTLGAGNAAFAPTDVYRLTCPGGTASARARVANPDGNPVDEITVEVIAPTGLVRSAISLEGVAPPTAVRTGAAGRYLVTVHKDAELIAARYSIVLDCHTAAGAAIAGNQTVRIQNQ